MRISLLKQRENFEEVFSRSIEDYLRARFQFPTNARWSGNDKGEFICNDYLNIVFHRGTPTRELVNFTQEFRYQANPIRRLAQTLYVLLACRKGIRRITCRRRLSLTPLFNESESWIFIPGNHSIRYINLRNNHSVVLPKTGFKKAFLRNEIKIRTQQKPSLTPKILTQDPNYEWFEEEVIKGLPYNRLSDSVEQSILFDECTASLRELNEKTKSQKSKQSYIASLREGLNNALKSLRDKISLQTAKILHETKTKILRELSLSNPRCIELALTHGDFQPANALRGNERSHLIDWEYSAKRSLYYDALTWETQIRSHQKFIPCFRTLLCSLNNHETKFAWTGRPFTHADRHYIWFFLLEDLLVKLEENDSDEIREKELSIGPYIVSLAKACEILSQY